MSSKRLSKRFYETVTIERAGEGRHWNVLLDGMQLRTPGKIKLTLPSQGLAEKIASEWDAQTEIINPSNMPVTRLANVAVEQTPSRRGDLIAEARKYTETDLLSYRAPQPRVLKERQSLAWDKWLDWAAKNGIVLKSTESLTALDQPIESLEKIETYSANLNDFQLTLFVHFIAVYGSTILGMAVMQGALSAEAAFDLSRVEAIYQIELWGEDEEQAEITLALRNETRLLGEVISDIEGT